jgi:hypothetical protein
VAGDLDRPPALLNESATAVEGARLHSDTQARDAVAAYRRPGMRRQ